MIAARGLGVALLVGLAALARAASITYDGWVKHAAQTQDRSVGVLTYMERVQAATISTAGVAVGLLALTVAGIVFVRWLGNAWAVSRAISPTPHRFEREWTVGAWLVPGFNLVLPPRVVGEIWRASAAGRNASTAPVSDWWTAVLIVWALDLYAMCTTDVYTAAVARTIEGVVTLVAAGLLMAIIVRISVWQWVAARRASREAPARAGVGGARPAAWAPSVRSATIPRPARRTLRTGPFRTPRPTGHLVVSHPSGPRR